MPQLQGHLPYCITVASDPNVQIAQFEYESLDGAQAFFSVLSADPTTICCDLCGPNDETLATYDRYQKKQEG